MAQQTINIGASPNDGTGTPLRTAFQYTNSNFSELYTAVGPSGNNIVVPGNATITGDLTVDTSTLKVDSANNRVGIGTASPFGPFHLVTTAAGFSEAGYFENSQAVGANVGPRVSLLGAGSVAMSLIQSGWNAAANTDAYLAFLTRGSGGVTERYRIASDGVATWSNVGGVAGTAMTLNATGLGVGAAPAQKLTVAGSAEITGGVVGQGALIGRDGSSGGATYSSNTGNTNVNAPASGSIRFNVNNGVFAGVFDANANLGIGVTPSYKLDTYTTLGGLVTEKRFANRTANKIIVKRYFGITADTALFSVQCGTAGDDKMAAFEINVFATGTKVGISSDRQFYGKFYVTRNAAGTFAITSAFSSGSAGAFTVTASGTSLNVNGIFSVISDGSACVEISGYIGGRDTIAETNFTVTMP